jgi:hypothetical protein
MKRLASLVLFLFVANFVFAAVGPHCANGLFGSPAQAATSPEAAAHDHAGDRDHHPSPTQDQGEVCSSMQLNAILLSTAMPAPPQVETTKVWAVATIYALVAALSPVKEAAAPLLPPLIASDFHNVHARTGRLLI